MSMARARARGQHPLEMRRDISFQSIPLRTRDSTSGSDSRRICPARARAPPLSQRSRRYGSAAHAARITGERSRPRARRVPWAAGGARLRSAAGEILEGVREVAVREAPAPAPASARQMEGGGTRSVRLVRKEGRDVSS